MLPLILYFYLFFIPIACCVTEIHLRRLRRHQGHEVSLTHRLRLCSLSVSTFCKYLFRQAVEVRASSLTAIYFQNKKQETLTNIDTHRIQFQKLSRSFPELTLKCRLPTITNAASCYQIVRRKLRNLSGWSRRSGRMVMNHWSRNETHETIVPASVLLLILWLL